MKNSMTLGVLNKADGNLMDLTAQLCIGSAGDSLSTCTISSSKNAIINLISFWTLTGAVPSHIRTSPPKPTGRRPAFETGKMAMAR